LSVARGAHTNRAEPGHALGALTEPGGALDALALWLRGQQTPISPFVVEARERPALGLLVAAGRASASAPAQYALVVESVREGYLLHFGRPRLLAGHDPDLALLAGDYLYALGIERLAALGDADAVCELADLISLCAQLHSEGRQGAVEELWSASVRAIADGRSGDHQAQKQALRSGRPHPVRSQ
jgi:hypothetical protein